MSKKRGRSNQDVDHAAEGGVAVERVDHTALTVLRVLDNAQLPTIHMSGGQDDEDDLQGADQNDDNDVLHQPAKVEGDLLSLFCAPVSRAEFFAHYWQKKALAVVNSNRQRLAEDVITSYLFDLDLEMLLECSPSELIHVWEPGKQGVKSYEASAKDALKSYKKNHSSLYFRAPQPLIDALVSNMFFSFGSAPFGWRADGSLRGEIETFVSRKADVIEKQITGYLLGVHDGQNGTRTIPLPVVEDEGVTSVVLNEGDILYFPSGLFHRVEAVEDSISINLSMDPASWAEVFGEAVTAISRRQDLLRQHIVDIASPVQPGWKEIATARLNAFKHAVNSLTIDQIFPDGLWRENPVPDNVVDLHAMSPTALASASTTRELHVDYTTRLQRNNLCVVHRLSEMAKWAKKKTDKKVEEDAKKKEAASKGKKKKGGRKKKRTEEDEEDEEAEGEHDNQEKEDCEASFIADESRYATYVVSFCVGTEELDATLRTEVRVPTQLIPFVQALIVLAERGTPFTIEDMTTKEEREDVTSPIAWGMSVVHTFIKKGYLCIVD